MKKIVTMAMMFAVLLAASFAAAGGSDGSVGDINVSNDNKNNNTNNVTDTAKAKAIAKQQQAQKQQQEQQQQQEQNQKVDSSGNASVTAPREFISAPTGPALMGVTVIPETKGCIAISPQSIPLEDIQNMNNGSFLEKKGGWFHGMFSSRIKHSVRIPFKGDKHHGYPIDLLEWDASRGFKLLKGDKKLGSFNCEGDYGFPLDATLGMCLEDAYEKTNMVQVYACYTVRTDAHSSGTAYSGGGAASAIPGSGDVAAAGSVAGTFGTSVAYANKAYDVELFAVAIAPPAPQPIIVYLPAPPAPAPVVAPPPPYVAPCPPPAPPEAKVCNPEPIKLKIQIELEGCKHCPKPCLNNEIHREQGGDYYADLYKCTGDKQYLYEAIKQYGIADRDFLNGREPDGTKTRTLTGAQEIMAKGYYNWSWCIRELDGPQVQYKFARQHKSAFLKEDGRIAVPSCYEDLKH